MAREDLNKYIKKGHIRAVEKFNEELKAWAKETGEDDATLYEDANTSFTLSNLRVEHGYLKYRYDSCDEKERIVIEGPREGVYVETEYDGIMDYVKFWRKCLKRAKRYWAMDPDWLDKIQDGAAEDINDDEED